MSRIQKSPRGSNNIIIDGPSSSASSSSPVGTSQSKLSVTKLAQKDLELIYHVVSENNIDPRSLAFEILFKRVSDIIATKASRSKGTAYSQFS